MINIGFVGVSLMYVGVILIYVGVILIYVGRNIILRTFVESWLLYFDLLVQKS